MDNIDTAEMLAAASSSGNSDALSLAIKLTATEPCVRCGYVKSGCKCKTDGQQEFPEILYMGSIPISSAVLNSIVQAAWRQDTNKLVELLGQPFSNEAALQAMVNLNAFKLRAPML